MEELRLAAQLLGSPEGAGRYIRRKIEQYPDWKVFDRQEAIARLSSLLADLASSDEDLLRVLVAYPL